MNLRFAFAVNNEGDFQEKYFGDVEKYIIFAHDSRQLVFIDEIINTKKILMRKLNMAQNEKEMKLFNI